MKDDAYAQFQRKLIPTVSPESIIGVRTPDLRKYAKELSAGANTEDFLCDLPHTYFEENQLHSFILSEERDYDRLIKKISEFLPFIDNWATCDQLSPKILKKHTEDLIFYLEKWIRSGSTYTVRFGLCMLMRYYLDGDAFKPRCLRLAAEVVSDEYYVKMMVAWYFATALAKQYDSALPYIENRVLEKWVHNKAIQKATESYRITQEQKDCLRKLKIK